MIFQLAVWETEAKTIFDLGWTKQIDWINALKPDLRFAASNSLNESYEAALHTSLFCLSERNLRKNRAREVQKHNAA